MEPLSEQKRKDFEESFHDRLVVEKKEPRLQFYDSEFLDFLEHKALQYLGDVRGSALLYYGCGENWSQANDFYQKGSYVTMIDISGASIDLLKRKVKEMNQEGFIIPLRLDCEHMEFDASSFDFIYGRAILHHLNLEKALAEISRVLRPGGRAVFLEPLGMNPILNLFRRLTPGRRTPYEHPFNAKDFLKMKKVFSQVFHEEFTLIALFGIAISSILRMIGANPIRLNRLQLVDAYLLRRYPALKKYCWNVVLCLQK